MLKLFVSIFAIFTVFLSASSAVDEKHCAPRPCCGCPGTGKSQVKALMNVFLTKIEMNQQSDAFELVSATNAGMFWYYSGQCQDSTYNIPDYFSFFFNENTYKRNVDFEYHLNHDGSIDVTFTALVVYLGNMVTNAYDMVYKWDRDAQCNWHISAINGTSTGCLLPTGK